MVSLPLVTEAHPIAHTFAPPFVHTITSPQFENPCHVYHAPESLYEEDEIHEEIKGMKESYQVLEKRSRVIEGDMVFGAAVKEICLLSAFVIPVKFKTPYFDNYEGHSCPKSHIIMKYLKMATHV